MSGIQFVTDRATMEGASELITMFGEGAGLEAAARADRSRAVGNVLHFCRWRQIERTIAVLAVEEPFDTVH